MSDIHVILLYEPILHCLLLNSHMSFLVLIHCVGLFKPSIFNCLLYVWNLISFSLILCIYFLVILTENMQWNRSAMEKILTGSKQYNVALNNGKGPWWELILLINLGVMYSMVETCFESSTPPPPKKKKKKGGGGIIDIHVSFRINKVWRWFQIHNQYWKFCPFKSSFP